MTSFGYASQTDRANLHKALEGPDYESPGGETLSSVMSYVQALLESCYSLGVDPIPSLREVFPNYGWHYVCLRHPSTVEIAIFSDLIWRVNWEVNFPDEEGSVVEYVTAERRNGVQGEKFIFLPEYAGIKRSKRLDFVQAFRGVAVPVGQT